MAQHVLRLIVNQGTAMEAMEVDRDKAAATTEEKLAALIKLQQQELVQMETDLKSAFQGETPRLHLQKPKSHLPTQLSTER